MSGCIQDWGGFFEQSFRYVRSVQSTLWIDPGELIENVGTASLEDG